MNGQFNCIRWSRKYQNDPRPQITQSQNELDAKTQEKTIKFGIFHFLKHLNDLNRLP